MQGSAGSFASGFIQAFLAARRLRMEEDHYQLLDQYYRKLMRQRNGAQDAFTAGKQNYYQRQGAGDGASGAGAGDRSSASGGAGSRAAGASGGDMPDPQTVSDYIQQRAPQYGIDPQTADKVYQSEGRSAYTGDNGSSFGPFQLHYGNVASGGNAVPGLGDDFTKQTGLDARDPSTWKQQVDFSLSQAAQNGWGAWHGAANSGIGEWDGIKRGQNAASLPPITPYQSPQNGAAVQPASASSPGASPDALHIGDSLATGTAQAMYGKDWQTNPNVTAVVGQNPTQVLGQISNLANGDPNYGGRGAQSLANRDIYISPGTSNVRDQNGWSKNQFDNGGLQTIEQQLQALKAGGADMSRVNVLGVGPGGGGDYANDKLQDLADDYGANFNVLNPNQYGPDGIHTTPQGYQQLLSPQGQSASADGSPTAIPDNSVAANDMTMGGYGDAAPPIMPDAPPMQLADVGGGMGDMGGGGFALADDAMAAAKGGVVRRYADGGPVEDDATSAGTGSDGVTDESSGGAPSALPVSNAAYSPGEQTPPAGSMPAYDPMTGEAIPVEPASYGYSFNAGSRMASEARHAGMPNMGVGMGGGLRAPSMGNGRLPMGMGRLPGLGANTGIDPNYDPQITDGQGGLSGGAVNAIQDGIQTLTKMFGLGDSAGGAIPGDPAQAQGRQAFLNGEGAMSPSEANAVKRSVDPNGTLDDSMANIAGLEALHKYYLAQGNIAGAGQTAAAMLLYSRETAAQYGSEAYNRLHKGDMHGAIKAIERGCDEVPDGMTVRGDVRPDGNVNVSQLDMQGNPVNQKVATPQEIMGAALGLKNGTLYWNLLNEATAGKQNANQQPMSPALQQALQGLTGQGGQPQGQPQGQAAPPPPAPQATPASAPVAIPDGQSPPPVQPASAAAPVTPQSNPTPPEAIPTTPTPISQPTTPPSAPPQPGSLAAQPSQVQDIAAFTNEVYRRLPQMPANLSRPAPGNLTPQEARVYQQTQRQVQGNWYKTVFAPAKAEADKMIQARFAYNNQQALQDRGDQQATARMVAQERLQSERQGQADKQALGRQQQQQQHDDEAEQDKLNAPLGMESPVIVGTDGDPYTHASNLMAPAFSPPGTDPAQAKATFQSRFDAETSANLRDATVAVARYSQLPPDSALRAVAAIVTPKTATGDDKLPFNATRDSHTGTMNVTFNNGMAVRMPAQTFTLLSNIRAAQRTLAANRANVADEQSRGRMALQQRRDALPDRLMSAPPPAYDTGNVGQWGP